MSTNSNAPNTSAMHDVCVIGAGWAGLTAAVDLREAGLDVVVVEKARGPGGRCSTRRQDGFAFDHGAQYFTARSTDFAAKVEEWKRAGLIAAWKPRMTVFGDRPRNAGTPPDQRLVATPSMNAVLKHLAQGLDCRYGWRAANPQREDNGWAIEEFQSPPAIRARHLLVTAPPRQAFDLLAGTTPLAEIAAGVPMRPSWALMLGFEQTLAVDFDAAFDNEGPLGWLARNSSKPGRCGEAWVAHASQEWSERHLESDAQAVTDELLAAFRQRVPAATSQAPGVIKAHRWRYALAAEPLKRACLIDEANGLVLAGDWCAGNRIEGAWSSGRAAAEQILAWYPAET
ncbi:MAG: FAD-dependent oxidoreductase [Wenzhouxiangella sp.]|nr:MAG: FAD-dependent oxidoreductase [Wenzhouxiangella sp.]